MTITQKISVVVPAYKSAQTLPTLVQGLEATLTALGHPFEVIIVDDCSPDDTWSVLSQLAQTHQFLKAIRLARNGGQHKAILCGFSRVTGDIVVTMDDDLQNPPSEIPKLIEPLFSGYDLAIGSYINKNHSTFKNLSGAFVDFTQRRIFNLPADFKLTSFRAIKRFIIDNVNKMNNYYPYITSMLLYNTNKYINVEVEHHKRLAGKSNYNLKRSLALTLNLWLNYSNYPLYFVVTLCVLSLFLGLGFAATVVWQALTSETTSGWASLIVTISFFNSLVLLALVVHSVYLSRLANSDSSFFISEKIINQDQPTEDDDQRLQAEDNLTPTTQILSLDNDISWLKDEILRLHNENIKLKKDNLKLKS
ncbi:MAG: glycosyltransferase family 2 protein [Deltaproteobacteria bacterium]|jgi:glycosyltransferase involved in cell wall biosynthesis|nr:glycosyltransferase family 2 protein [Deltaproteobacteria bacterium]